MQKLKDMKIKKRLNTGFKMVTGIATIAAVRRSQQCLELLQCWSRLADMNMR